MKLLTQITATTESVDIDFETSTSKGLMVGLNLDSVTIPGYVIFYNLKPIEHLHGSVYRCTFTSAIVK